MEVDGVEGIEGGYGIRFGEGDGGVDDMILLYIV